MKKFLRVLSAILSVVMMLSYITAFADTTKSIQISSVTVEPGAESQITVTVNGFQDLVGGYYFELDFPEFATINSVFRDGIELENDFDYNVWNDNILIISETIGYSDNASFCEPTVFTVNFTADSTDEITSDVTMTDESCIIYDDEVTEFFPADITESGSIEVAISNYLKADINKDGSANATDLSLLRKNLIEEEITDTFYSVAADVNEDSVIDIKDLVAFKKYLVRTVVYLSDNGDDSNVGDSADAPVATLDRAIEQVYESGTVYITDTYTAISSWSDHMKFVEISGGTYDASALSSVSIGDDTTFTAVTLSCKSGGNIYANGNKVKINEDVTVSGKPYLYGGGTTEVASTDIEVYSGSYQHIYGGGNGAGVTGNTNVQVGGTVNSDLDEADHSGGVYIIGGCNNAVVGGNTYLTIGGSTKSTHIYGAGVGASSNVLGKTNVTINGGSFMSAYAGSTNGICTNTELTLAGGTIEQVFGGNSSASMKGDTRLNIIGGTVTRRIYGGCYNDLTGSGLSYTWQSTNHVIGNTTVFLSSNADVTLSWKESTLKSPDRGIFACSRYSSLFDDEFSTIIYENSVAQSEFSGKVGQQDTASKLISSWPSGYDTTSIQG